MQVYYLKATTFEDVEVGNCCLVFFLWMLRQGMVVEVFFVKVVRLESAVEVSCGSCGWRWLWGVCCGLLAGCGVFVEPEHLL